MKKIPIYVINLDSSPKRFETIHAQTKKMGLEIKRISGINGNELTDAEIKENYSETLNNKRFRRKLTRGEIGCHLSHRKIWKKLVDENIDIAIILEDDALLMPYFPEVIKQISKLKGTEDLIKLLETNEPFHRKKALSDGFFLVNFKRIPNCVTAYGLTFNGAKKLLTRKHFYRNVDWDIQFCHEINLSVLGIIPYSVISNSAFTSDLVNLNGGFHSYKASSLWHNIKFRAQIYWHRIFYTSGTLPNIKSPTLDD